MLEIARELDTGARAPFTYILPSAPKAKYKEKTHACRRKPETELPLFFLLLSLPSLAPTCLLGG